MREHRDDRNRQARRRAPEIRARTNCCDAHASAARPCSSALRQHRLRRVVDARRDERDRVGGDDLALGVEDLHRQADAAGRARDRAAPGCRPRAPSSSSIVVITVDGRDAIARRGRRCRRRSPAVRRGDAVVAAAGRDPRGPARRARRASPARGLQRCAAPARTRCWLIAPAREQRLQPLDLAAFQYCDVGLARRRGCDSVLRTVACCRSGSIWTSGAPALHAIARLDEDARDRCRRLAAGRGRVQRPHGRDEVGRVVRSASAASVTIADAGRRAAAAAAGRRAWPAAIARTPPHATSAAARRREYGQSEACG